MLVVITSNKLHIQIYIKYIQSSLLRISVVDNQEQQIKHV